MCFVLFCFTSGSVLQSISDPISNIYGIARSLIIWSHFCSEIVPRFLVISIFENMQRIFKIFGLGLR